MEKRCALTKTDISDKLHAEIRFFMYIEPNKSTGADL